VAEGQDRFSWRQQFLQASNPGKMRRKQETVRPEALFLTTAIGFSSTVTVNLPEG
jgi:hypothetical protein